MMNLHRRKKNLCHLPDPDPRIALEPSITLPGSLPLQASFDTELMVTRVSSSSVGRALLSELPSSAAFPSPVSVMALGFAQAGYSPPKARVLATLLSLWERATLKQNRDEAARSLELVLGIMRRNSCPASCAGPQLSHNSTIANTLLNEMPPESGQLVVPGSLTLEPLNSSSVPIRIEDLSPEQFVPSTSSNEEALQDPGVVSTINNIEDSLGQGALPNLPAPSISSSNTSIGDGQGIEGLPNSSGGAPVVDSPGGGNQAIPESSGPREKAEEIQARGFWD